MLTVVLMLWDDPKHRWHPYYRYGARHVRTMRTMVDRHLRMPHRFVLATDNLDHDVGDDDIDKVRLPDELLRLGHRWAKLILFAPDAYDMFGDRFLYIDLDTLIVRDIDPLISGDDFRIMAKTIPLAVNMPYNSSMILMDTGARPQVWSAFDPARATELCAANGYSASDQFWIGQVLGDGERTWDRADGIYPFREVMDPNKKRLPDDARVICFAGPYDPSMPTLQRAYPWIAQHYY